MNKAEVESMIHKVAEDLTEQIETEIRKVDNDLADTHLNTIENRKRLRTLSNALVELCDIITGIERDIEQLKVFVASKTVGDYYQAYREAYKKAYGTYPEEMRV